MSLTTRFSAALLVSPTARQTLPAVTHAATGTVRFVGTSTQTLTALRGRNYGVGKIEQTLPPVTQVATGTLRIQGAIEQTIAGAAQSASGALRYVGDADQTVGAVAQTAAGVLRITGSVAQTLTATAQSASGPAPAIVGTAVQDLPRVRSAARISGGAAVQTLPPISHVVVTRKPTGAIYLAWTEPDRDFDAALHARYALTVLRLTLEEREGEHPAATLEIVNPGGGPLALQGRYAWVSQQDADGVTPLILGRVTGVPQDLTGETVELELVARPPDWRTRLDAAADAAAVHPYYDPLYTDPARDFEPEDALAGRAAHYRWDPVTHQVAIVDLVEGGQTRDFTGADRAHLYDGFSARIGEAPTPRVDLQVTAEWVQDAAGTVDLSDHLQDLWPRNFTGGLTGETLTHEDLRRSWYRPGQGIGGQSGYRVRDAAVERKALLDEVRDPENRGDLTVYAISYRADALRGLYRVQAVSRRPGQQAAADDDTLRLEVRDPAGEVLGRLTPGDPWSGAITIDTQGTPEPGDTWYVGVGATTTDPVPVSASAYPYADPARQRDAGTREVVLERTLVYPRLALDWRYQQSRRQTVEATVHLDAQDVLAQGEDADAERIELRLAHVAEDTETPYWQPGTDYAVGDVVRHGDTRYECTQAHTSSLFGFVFDDFFSDYWQALPDDGTAIGDIASDDFWGTARGRQALEHALARAAATLRERARVVEIRARYPWHRARDVTTRDALTIADPRLPGGQATGKVAAVRLEHSSAGATGEVTLRATPGVAATPAAGDGETQVPDYPGLVYLDYTTDPPRDLDLSRMSDPKYVVQDFAVTHAAPDQERFLQQRAPAQSDLRALLSQVPTQTSLTLRDLAARHRTEETVTVDLPHRYPVPAQIDLGAT